MKNICGKARSISKGQTPYITWTDPRTGWQHKLLKTYTASNKGPHARWLMDTEGWGHDVGDTYTKELLPGLMMAAQNGDNLEWDRELWPTYIDLEKWIRQ